MLVPFRRVGWGKYRVCPCKGLSTGLEYVLTLAIMPHPQSTRITHSSTPHILASWIALIVCQISKECLKIAWETCNAAGSYKGVNLRAPIQPVIEFPRMGPDRDGCDWAASRRDGSSTTKSCEPDHNLIFVTTSAGTWGKDIVGNICNDVTDCVPVFLNSVSNHK